MIIEQLPQTKTLEFERAEKFGLERIAAYYRDCDYNICEYSLGIKLMCASLYRYRFAEVAGCLICRDEYEGIVYFDYPVVGPDGDLEAALSAIETYCMEKDIPLRYTTLPPSALGLLTARYDGVRLRKTYECRDYCYRTEEIVEFAGKKYAGQRNHVRRFYRQYPNAVFRKMSHVLCLPQTKVWELEKPSTPECASVLFSSSYLFIQNSKGFTYPQQILTFYHCRKTVNLRAEIKYSM